MSYLQINFLNIKTPCFIHHVILLQNNVPPLVRGGICQVSCQNTTLTSLNLIPMKFFKNSVFVTFLQKNDTIYVATCCSMLRIWNSGFWASFWWHLFIHGREVWGRLPNCMAPRYLWVELKSIEDLQGFNPLLQFALKLQELLPFLLMMELTLTRRRTSSGIGVSHL